MTFKIALPSGHCISTKIREQDVYPILDTPLPTLVTPTALFVNLVSTHIVPARCVLIYREPRTNRLSHIDIKNHSALSLVTIFTSPDFSSNVNEVATFYNRTLADGGTSSTVKDFDICTYMTLVIKLKNKMEEF